VKKSFATTLDTQLNLKEWGMGGGGGLMKIFIYKRKKKKRGGGGR